MNLKNELKQRLQLSTPGMSRDLIDIGLKNTFTARIGNDYCIAITEIDGEPFEMHAVGVQLARQQLDLLGVIRNCLVLKTSKIYLLDIFCHLAVDMITSTQTGGHREQVIKDAVVWWEYWGDLLGDARSQALTHAWFGELYFYYRLLKNGIRASWTSLENCIWDFQTDRCRIEVKTSLKRSTSEATISSAFQLAREEDVPLYLIYLKVCEDQVTGLSINDLLNELQELIDDKKIIEEVEKYLSRNGVLKGKIRNIKYFVLEEVVYPIDESFPAITDDSFKDDILPAGIIGLTYTVSLDAVKNRIGLDEFLKTM